jgi:hypothetical protein
VKRITGHTESFRIIDKYRVLKRNLEKLYPDYLIAINISPNRKKLPKARIIKESEQIINNSQFEHSKEIDKGIDLIIKKTEPRCGECFILPPLWGPKTEGIEKMLNKALEQLNNTAIKYQCIDSNEKIFLLTGEHDIDIELMNKIQIDEIEFVNRAAKNYQDMNIYYINLDPDKNNITLISKIRPFKELNLKEKFFEYKKDEFKEIIKPMFPSPLTYLLKQV